MKKHAKSNHQNIKLLNKVHITIKIIFRITQIIKSVLMSDLTDLPEFLPNPKINLLDLASTLNQPPLLMIGKRGKC